MTLKALMVGGAAALLGLAGTTAPPAVADEVWHQAYERPSADAACPSPADETPWQATFTGQQEWTPSWAAWADGGRGGWVCQRSLVWARSSSAPTYPSAGCVYVDDEPTYVDFRGGWFLTYSFPGIQGYSDPSCTTNGDTYTADLVYAPAGYDPSALCLEAFGSDELLATWPHGATGVYGCVAHAF